MSTSQPPDGVGRYERSFDVNVQDPELLAGHAHSRLALGTVDLPRIARVAFDLHSANMTTARREALIDLRPGDLIALTDLPATLIAVDLDQIVQGWTEVIDTHVHTIDANTTPAAPWQTLEWGEDAVLEEARYDTSSSILLSGVPASSTTLYVDALDGPDWTTDSDDLPFDVDIDGLRVTVTAIADSGTAQVFTVSAISRGLPGGATVKLADPAYWSL